jgi:integrase
MTITEAYPAFDFYLEGENLSDKTRKEYYGGVLGRNGLIGCVGDIPIELIGITHITKWKVDMRDAGLCAAYINNKIQAVRRLFRWIADPELGYGLKVMDYEKIKFDKEERGKPKTVLTKDEVGSLVASAHTLRDKAIIMLYFGTGCRASEILDLDRWDWEAATLVDSANGVWEFEVLGKNRKYRPVCMFQDVKVAIDVYLESRKDHYRPLFISRHNKRVHYTTVNQMIHDAAARAGLTKRVTPHVARHTFITDRAAAGTPIPILAYQVGHAHGGITQKIYTHINKTHSQQAFAQFRPGKM